MRRIRYLILLSVLFQLVGCSNINDIKEQEPAISMLPTHEPHYNANTGTSEPNIEPDVTPSDGHGKISPEPTENATTNGTVHNIWPPDKPDYSVNMNNYDLAGDKERYLLRVNLYPGGDYDFPIIKYFVDVNEIDKITGYYEISDSSLIPKELQQNVLRISRDGQKALLIFNNPPDGEDRVVEVLDLINHKTLYQFKTQGYLDNVTVASTPNLDYLLLPTGDGNLHVDLKNKKETNIHTPRRIISPDGSKTVTITNIKKSKLQIYDLLYGELLDEVDLGNENAYLTQWNETGKILYYTFDGSFYYDLNTKEIVSLGSYFYGPVMSPDGKYVAYYRSDDIYPFFPLWADVRLYKECGYEEGLYIKNLITGNITQVAPVMFNDFVIFNMAPIEWVYVNKDFDNSANRYFAKEDTEGEYHAICSSMKDTYYFGNVIDKNINTAWVEDHLPTDENGIGEWIKIYKYTQLLTENIDCLVQVGYLQSVRLTGIKIVNGYAKSEETYKANNRVKKVEVILTDGTSYIFDLKDDTLDFQTLDFGKEVETRDVTIKILDIYEGTKYNDTCISEVQLIEAE